MFGAVATDDGAIIAFGLRGNAFSTRDLGRTWTALDTGTEASLMGGAAVSGGRAVLVGASGTVLLAPAGSQQLRAYNFADGGVMSAVIPLSDTEFLTIGENGIARNTSRTDREKDTWQDSGLEPTTQATHCWNGSFLEIAAWYWRCLR